MGLKTLNGISQILSLNSPTLGLTGLNVPTITFKTIVSAFTPNNSSVAANISTLSPDYLNNTSICGAYGAYPSCTSTISVQNLSTFAIEKNANTPLIEKNGAIKNTIRYGNLDTTNSLASSQFIDVFPFSNQTPSRSPATSFSGSLSFNGLVVAPNSNSSDPNILNTNDNITTGGLIQYTKRASSQLANDPCDVSNNPAGIEVNTNPRCASLPTGNLGTASTIWCTAFLDTTNPTVKRYSLLNNAGVYSGTAGANSTSCPTSLDQVTGVRFTTGVLPTVGSGATIYEVELNFNTSGNTNNDIYTNIAQARAAGVATISTTNSAVTKVSSGSVSGNIFNDKNSNGIKDTIAPNDDLNLSGVSVELRYGTGNVDGSGNPITAGTLITTVTTDTSGNYTFPNLNSGNYTVIVLQNGIPLSNQTKDPDATVDSKTDVTLGFTNGVGVNSIGDVNFGYNQYGKITGKLYADVNNNGTQDGTEPDFNSTTNTIPSGTSVVITSTSNPSISYTLTVNASTTQVGGFTTSSIATNGTFSQDLPVGEYTVTVNTSNPRYRVSTSTELGDATGANPSTLTMSFGETKSAGSDGLYLVQIQNTDIIGSTPSTATSISCTPNSTNVNTTTNCTITLAGTNTFNNLSGSVDFRIGNSGAIKTCPIPTTGNTLTCNGISVGANTGTFPAQFKGSTDTTFVTGPNGVSPTNITVTNPIQNSDIDGIACQSPKGVNSTSDCIITLTANAVTNNRAFNNLTGSIALQISNGTLKICNLFNTSTTPFNALSCSAVEVGSLISSGNGYTVKYALNGSTTTADAPNTPAKSNYVVVNNAIQPSNISSVVCQTPKLINQTTDCVVTLSGATNFNNLTGDIKIKISDGLNTACPAFPTTGNTLTCTLTPVGTLIGTYKPAYSLNSATAITTGSTDIVINNPLTQAQLPGLTITCDPAPANSTTTCTFTLPPNTTLPPDFKIAIGDGALGGTCTVTNQTTGQVTCTNVPTGSLTGSQPIKVQIGTGTVVTTTQPSGAVSNPIQNTNIQSLNCTPATTSVNQTTDCTVTLSGTITFANLSGSVDFRIGNTGTVKTCNVPTVGTTLLCTGVNVGGNIGTFASQFKGSGTSTTYVNGNNITINNAFIPSDISSLTVTCGITSGSGSITTAPLNSTTTCTFTLPNNKTLPSDFKLITGTGATDAGGSTPAQSCTVTNTTTNTVTCTNVPTGNSVGNIPIYGQLTGTNNSKTLTGESVAITGTNFGKVDWVFNPDQGGSSPLFKSQDNTSITIKNLKTVFDLSPSSNTKYTCTLEYRNLNDRNSNSTGTGLTWTELNTTPIPYIAGTGTNSGCTVNLTKAQRGNILNQSFRLTITDTTITNPSTTNPNTYTFYNEYIFRFQGAGVAAGSNF
jgi:hypothetical protein